MVAHDTMRRSGGWTVELVTPLKSRGQEITEIDIQPPIAAHTVRWAHARIPSFLALLSELCGIPEKLLLQLPNSDFDRVMFAFIFMMPPVIKAGWESGERPLATPEDDLPADERYVPPPDQLDPRFPAVDGPVVRMKPTPPASAPVIDPDMENGAAMMDMAPPSAIAPVHSHG